MNTELEMLVPDNLFLRFDSLTLDIGSISLDSLEKELEESHFFRSDAQRPSLMLNIRNFFFRSSPTQQDVNTLHGMVKALTGKKHPKKTG